jgi:hypothetical protein
MSSPTVSSPTVDWLSNALADEEVLAPEAVHRALALLHVCRTVDPSISAAVKPLVADLLDRELAFGRVDLITGVLSATIAAAEGSGEASEYVDLLAGLVEEPGIDGANVLFARLALGAIDGDGVGHVSRQMLAGRWYRAAAEVEPLIELVETESQFGTRPATVEDGLAEMLEAATLAAARNYDLALTLRCLRASAYADALAAPGTRMAIEFLAASRNPDGSFGFYDTPASIVERDAAAGRSLLPLRLAVTTEAIWATAEIADPGWRLLGKAGRR